MDSVQSDAFENTSELHQEIRHYNNWELYISTSNRDEGAVHDPSKEAEFQSHSDKNV